MMQNIWLKIRRLGIELYCFLTAPFIVRNCLGLLVFFGGLFLLTFWWLKCYTNHGESLQVPSYVGMRLREAALKARAHVLQHDGIDHAPEARELGAEFRRAAARVRLQGDQGHTAGL